jgi:hypothetical protein
MAFECGKCDPELDGVSNSETNATEFLSRGALAQYEIACCANHSCRSEPHGGHLVGTDLPMTIPATIIPVTSTCKVGSKENCK